MVARGPGFVNALGDDVALAEVGDLGVVVTELARIASVCSPAVRPPLTWVAERESGVLGIRMERLCRGT